MAFLLTFITDLFKVSVLHISLKIKVKLVDKLSSVSVARKMGHARMEIRFRRGRRRVFFFLFQTVQRY